MAKCDNLCDYLTCLADKIRSKLGITDLINPQDFDTKIDDICAKCDEDFWRQFQRVNGSGVAERRSYNQAFMNWNAVEIKPQFAVANASNDWRYAFYNCSKLTSFDFSDWTYVTTNEADTSYMFSGCTYLTSLDWNTHFKLAPFSATQMFFNCKNLKTITNFNIGSLTNVGNMFTGCTALETFGFTGDIIADGLDFHNSTKLKEVDYIIQDLEGFNSIDATPTVSRTITFDSGAPDRVIEEQQITMDYWNWLVSTAANANWTIALL